MGVPDEDAEWWDRTSRALWNLKEAHYWDSVSESPPPDLATSYFNIPIDSCRGGSEREFDDATRIQLENLGYL
jgi:hypothetical protein